MPSESDMNRVRDSIGGDNDLVSLNLSDSRFEFSIASGNLEMI